MTAGRPEGGVAVLPDADNLGGGHDDTRKSHAKRLLPQLAEALERAHHAAALHIQIQRTARAACNVEPVDRFGPVGFVARLVPVSRSIHHMCSCPAAASSASASPA